MTESFNIIGISIRTSNSENRSQQDIGALWQKFFAENIAAKIPSRISDDIFSIYTDYDSDYTGEYTTLLGMKVSALDDIPEGLTGRHFPAENFRKFTATGPMPDAVAATWTEIWSRDAALKRKYTYDYEVYGEKSQNGAHSQVEIYIATN